ncbi:MAG: NDP-sugar synthase [Actinomycetota bacterium]
MIEGVVFAAGRGTRLLPITETLPKPLVPILDVPLIDLALDAVRPVADEIVVNVSHLSGLVAEHLVGRPRVSISDEGAEPLGTAGTLLDLRDRLGQTFVTYNCDLVSDLDMARLLAEHERSGRTATLACIPVETAADFSMDGAGISLVDRRARSVSGYRFIGAAAFARESIDLIVAEPPVGLTEGLLRHLVDEAEVSLFVHDGYAEDAGTLRRVVEISKDALEGRVHVPHPGVVLERSPSFAYRGPGATATADDGALGPGAIILSGATIQAGATVADSIVWTNEELPAVNLRDQIYFDGRALDLET